MMPETRDLADLRSRHERLTFRSYDVRRASGALEVTFRIDLSPDITFTPRLTIPNPLDVPLDGLEAFIASMGMIELVSYWKAACPPVVEIEALALDSYQTAWWHRLMF